MKRFWKWVCCLCAALLCFGVAACSQGTNEPVDSERDGILFMIGDSLFDFWKETCAEDLGTDDVFNMAIGGTTSEFWIENFSIIDRQAERLSRLYDVKGFMISLGTNDICYSNDGLQTAEGENGLQDFLQLLHKFYSDAHIYLLTINICGETTRWDLREEVRECNSIMREYCKQFDWMEMVETETAFYNDTNYDEKPAAEYFTQDYLHFSEQGYKVLAGILRKALGLAV